MHAREWDQHVEYGLLMPGFDPRQRAHREPGLLGEDREREPACLANLS